VVVPFLTGVGEGGSVGASESKAVSTYVKSKIQIIKPINKDTFL
jgi:hypothetical protein